MIRTPIDTGVPSDLKSRTRRSTSPKKPSLRVWIICTSFVLVRMGETTVRAPGSVAMAPAPLRLSCAICAVTGSSFAMPSLFIDSHAGCDICITCPPCERYMMRVAKPRSATAFSLSIATPHCASSGPRS